MANGGRFNVTVGLQVDKASILKVQQEIAKATTVIGRERAGKLGIDNSELAKLKSAATALQKAYNPFTQSLSTKTFLNELNKAGTSIQQMGTTLIKTGADGQQAFIGLGKQLMNIKTVTQSTNNFLDQMSNTLVNAFKWNVAYGALNKITSTLKASIKYVQDIDKGLTDIQMVTGASNVSMQNFAVSAREAAHDLSISSKEYIEASTIFFRQGLSIDAVQKRTEIATKVSKITGQSTRQTADQMTAL